MYEQKKSIHEGPRELALIKITYIGNQFIYSLVSGLCVVVGFFVFVIRSVRFVSVKWFHFSISNRFEMNVHKMYVGDLKIDN